MTAVPMAPLFCWLYIAAMLCVPMVLGAAVSWLAPLTYPF